MDESTVSAVCSIVSDVTGVNERDISCDTSFANLDADAFDIEEIVLAVEDRFDVFILNSEKINSVGDLVCAVAENR